MLASIRPRPAPLLHLPPALRLSLYQHGQHALHAQHAQHRLISPRHASRAYSTDLASMLAALPGGLMSYTHSLTGLPWWAVLPLSALMIRTLVVYPFCQRPFRVHQARRAFLKPLLDAELSFFRRQYYRERPHSSWPEQRFRLWQHYFVTSHKLGKEFKAPFSIGRKLGGFAVLLTVSDALRRLCGLPQGLLTILLGPFQSVIKRVVEKLDQTEAHSQQLLANSQRLPSQSPPPTSPSILQDAISTPAVPARSASDSLPTADADAAAATWFDESMLIEGPSWCPNLTSADPTLALPVIFWGAFMTAIYFGPRLSGSVRNGPSKGLAVDADTALSEAKKRGKMTNMQRIGMSIAILSIFPAVKMPAALLIYFISNIGISSLQTRHLARVVPIRPAPAACKRPVRMSPIRERLDVRISLPKRAGGRA